MTTLRTRRILLLLVPALSVVVLIGTNPGVWKVPAEPVSTNQNQEAGGGAKNALDTLAVKGRAPKTGYARTQFGNGWTSVQGCDTRNTVLARDMTDVKVDEACRVTGGVLNDPYTGRVLTFVRGQATSQEVQIDHVVALSNAWQTGAQQLDEKRRVALANDPLNLLAVEGKANQQKSDGDAATWLPPNRPFRCQYVARQIAVKQKYQLWVTISEKEAIEKVLAMCPNQQLPTEGVLQ
jgi:hypothetical protein